MVRLPGNGNGENGMIHPVHRTPFHAHHHRHARVDSPKCPLPRVVSPLTVSPCNESPCTLQQQQRISSPALQLAGCGWRVRARCPWINLRCRVLLIPNSCWCVCAGCVRRLRRGDVVSPIGFSFLAVVVCLWTRCSWGQAVGEGVTNM
jgi:hypothetical protein